MRRRKFLGTGLAAAATLPWISRRALAASAAIPGVFPPIVIDGRTLIDGGVSANLPIRQAAELGAAAIVSLDVTPTQLVTNRDPGLFSGLAQAGTIMLRNQASWEAEGVPIVRLPSPSPPDAGLFAFRRWKDFRDEGYRVASAALAG